MASQAKIPHFSLLLCLLITLATISQASTQIKNFNKVSRENFNKQSAEQAPLQKDDATTTTTTENTPLDSTESQYGLYNQKGSDSQVNNNDEWYGDRQFEVVDKSRFPTGSNDNALRDWQYAQWNKHQLEKQQKLKAQSQDPEGQVYKRTSYQKTSGSLDRNDQKEYVEDNNNNNNNDDAYDNEKSEVDNSDQFPTDDIAHWSFSQFQQWDKYQREKQKLKDQSQDSEKQVYKRTSYKKIPDSWNRNNNNNNNQQDFVEDNDADSYETPANTDVSRWDNNNYMYGNREEEDDQKYEIPDNNRWDSQYKSYEQQQQQQQQPAWNYENVNKQQKKGRSKEERLANARGMSDTRKTKYYYDIENDKYGEDHPFTKLNSYNGNSYANQFGEEEEEP